MNKKTYWLTGIIVIIVVAILFSLSYRPSNRTSVKNSGAINPQNATYVIEGQSFTLINGQSIVSAAPGSAEKITTQYFGNEATGDLNGDGLPDKALLLTQNSGGSGTFYYVAVALATPQGYIGANGVLLGDRVSPQTTEIKNAEVIVNYADRKEGEPMTTTPSVGVSKYLGFKGNQLVEIPNPDNTSIIYKNTDFGFNFSLPVSWQGYTVVSGKWTGTPITKTSTQTGPKLLIRNPQWTTATPHEDLPILIFTLAQWKAYLAENFSISAAPILASELARNNKYVFALPPRWDYDYSLGYQEAEAIISSKPLQAFDL